MREEKEEKENEIKKIKKRKKKKKKLKVNFKEKNENIQKEKIKNIVS